MFMEKYQKWHEHPEHRLQTQLQSQAAILSFVLDHSLTVTKSIWISVQSKILKIYSTLQ